MKNLLFELKKDLSAYLLLLAGFVLRIYYIFSFTTPEKYLWSDPGAYDLRALQMAKDQYVMFSTYWPPFFHIILSFLYRPLVWLNLVYLRIKVDVIIFALLYIIAFFCIYQIVKKMFSQKIALVVLAILIVWYPFIFLNYLVMSENLFILLFFVGLYFLITKTHNLYTGTWLGFLWACALLTRPIFALVLPFFALWGLVYKIDKKFLFGFMAMGAIIIFSMMAFNFYYTKGAEHSISSNSGVGLATLWCNAKSMEFNANGYTFGFGPPANIDYPEERRFFTTVPFENQTYYYKMGWSCLKSHPHQLVDSLSSPAKAFSSYLFPTIGNVAYWEQLHIIFKTISQALAVLSLVTITGLLLNLINVGEENKKYFYLMGLVILSMILTLYLQNTGEERYLIPYQPLLIILTIPLLANAKIAPHS